jgi:hypothetical protein
LGPYKNKCRASLLVSGTSFKKAFGPIFSRPFCCGKRF